MVRRCLTCEKEFRTYPCFVRKGQGKFCSSKCYGKSMVGIPNNRGEKNGQWKGDNVGYMGLHTWIRRRFGLAKDKQCVFCGSRKNLHWANVSRKYKRDINDWITLCCKCHGEYDKNNQGVIAKLFMKEVGSYRRRAYA